MRRAAVLAAAVGFAPFPSPTAPLSPEPPLMHGASASTEGVRHHVSASTRVDVSVDAQGRPFAVAATQRLDVRVAGDYFFTVRAPVTAVRAVPGSASEPGFRVGAIVWEGFDAGRRVLAARATLEPGAVGPSLPLRIVVSDGRTTLVNATRIDAAAGRATATPGSVRAYLAQLRTANAAGTEPAPGRAQVEATPVPVRLSVAAPLEVTGTVGGRRVSLLLTGRTTVPAAGRVHLRVTPVPPQVPARLPRDGAELFTLASRLSLETARARQFRELLGNPDPDGPSETTFVYRTQTPPTAAAPLVTRHHGRGLLTIALVAAALAAALCAAVVLWARS
ncbi:MAG TPA: hypothetical protein VHC67_17600 [Gaiellaceae bacterium]|nr:hypothetical protein [Gaiellaceae bacterium]